MQELQQRHINSRTAYRRACNVLVGGVNSPVRAFKSVGGDPVFVKRAQGPYIFDLDDNRYIDLVGTWGPAIVGHAHRAVLSAVDEAVKEGLSFGASCERETLLAEIICGALPSVDLLRFVNSGTEAVMSAIRLGRAATGRSKIIKFHGCYHGHSDGLLVSAGSGATTMGVPDSAGVTPEIASLTLLARYNDLQSVERIMSEHGDDVAAVLVEPVAGNMGFIEPVDGFLPGLRESCDRHGALLIFDEVMTGFRVAWGGMQIAANVTPDVTCLGKVIGGGMPVAAYGGGAELMSMVSPMGPVYQAGTLSGNPVGMAAGLATLQLCSEPGFYEALQHKTAALTDGLRRAATDAGIPLQANARGGMFGMYFAAEPVRDFDGARAADHNRFAKFFHAMLERGVWLPPSGYEAMFLSAAHEEEHIEQTVSAAAESFRQIAS